MILSLLRLSGQNKDHNLDTQRKETSTVVVKATLTGSTIAGEVLGGVSVVLVQPPSATLAQNANPTAVPELNSNSHGLQTNPKMWLSET